MLILNLSGLVGTLERSSSTREFIEQLNTRFDSASKTVYAQIKAEESYHSIIMRP